MSKENIVNEIHRNARKNFPRRHVVMKDIDDLWQADLIDMQSVYKDNKNYKYILAVIDTFSKYAWAYPLKLKKKENIIQAFKKLLEAGRIPKNLQTDFGTEFYNKSFKSLVNKYGINHYSTYSTKKASIVERFIRTLKSKIYKQFHLQGSYNWLVGLLDNSIKSYNNKTHRTIGLAPAEVNKNNKKLLQERYKKIQTLRLKKCRMFKLGEFVRISKYKGTFEKGYTPNWSTEIFKIVKVQETNPVTYLLEDANHQPILGSFYSQELQKTKYPNNYLVEKVIKRKKNKLFVKWLGLSSRENCWIDKTNIL